MSKILTINPGSTSTKFALFDDKTELFGKTIRHDPDELEKFGGIINEFDFRKNLILKTIDEHNFDLKLLKCVVGRGGLVRKVSCGTYKINEKMLNDLRNPYLWGRIHASNLGAFIAKSIADELGIPSFIADPITVDEMPDVARISGIPQIEREAMQHTLNLRYTAIKMAEEMGRPLVDIRFIGVHMGGGISIIPVAERRILDVNNALLGMGPFSPQRAGALPIGDLIDMCYSQRFTKKELKTYLAKRGGWIAYLGTDDCHTVEHRIARGDKKAKLIHNAMCYQVAKEIGAAATVLEGRVDVIFLTGGLAHGKMVVDEISRRVSFIAPIRVYPGEFEMEALAQAGMRVLKGEEEALEY